MSETFELLHPTHWMILTALLTVLFLVNRQWVHMVMMMLCFGGWMAARAGLKLGEGQPGDPMIPIHWIVLIPFMFAMGGATVMLMITGVSAAVGMWVAKRFKDEKGSETAAAKTEGEAKGDVDGSAG